MSTETEGLERMAAVAVGLVIGKKMKKKKKDFC
jgi:hypothetical protein